MTILSILDQLQANSSTLEKQNILKNNESDLLKRVLRLTYDSALNFYIKKIPPFESSNTPTFCLDDALDLIEKKLTTRDITGNNAFFALQNCLISLPSDDAEVLSRVIERDLKVGINTKLINKVFPGLISEMEVMLADSDLSRIKYPAICQPKLDGLRAHITRRGDSIFIVTRNGKLIDDLDQLKDSAMALMYDGETWDGEIVCVDKNDPNIFSDRKTSNGILNKSIRGTITSKEAALMRFNTWDIIDSIIPYSLRLWILRQRFDSICYNPGLKFYPILGKVVESYEEAMEIYDNEIAKGNEGVILKNMNAKWVPKRSKDLCKIKEIKDCDLRVIGWEIGTGKNANRLGNLILSSEDAQLEVAVGTGFSDDQRDFFTKDYVMGKIAAIQYNQIIKAKNTDSKYSLFLPRFIEFRDDKDVANILKEIK